MGHRSCFPEVTQGPSSVLRLQSPREAQTWQHTSGHFHVANTGGGLIAQLPRLMLSPAAQSPAARSPAAQSLVALSPREACGWKLSTFFSDQYPGTDAFLPFPRVRAAAVLFEIRNTKMERQGTGSWQLGLMSGGFRVGRVERVGNSFNFLSSSSLILKTGYNPAHLTQLTDEVRHPECSPLGSKSSLPTFTSPELDIQGMVAMQTHLPSLTCVVCLA